MSHLHAQNTVFPSLPPSLPHLRHRVSTVLCRIEEVAHVHFPSFAQLVGGGGGGGEGGGGGGGGGGGRGGELVAQGFGVGLETGLGGGRERGREGGREGGKETNRHFYY